MKGWLDWRHRCRARSLVRVAECAAVGVFLAAAIAASHSGRRPGEGELQPNDAVALRSGLAIDVEGKRRSGVP